MHRARSSGVMSLSSSLASLSDASIMRAVSAWGAASSPSVSVTHGMVYAMINKFLNPKLICANRSGSADSSGMERISLKRVLIFVLNMISVRILQIRRLLICEICDSVCLQQDVRVACGGWVGLRAAENSAFMPPVPRAPGTRRGCKWLPPLRRLPDARPRACGL